MQPRSVSYTFSVEAQRLQKRSTTQMKNAINGTGGDPCTSLACWTVIQRAAQSHCFRAHNLYLNPRYMIPTCIWGSLQSRANCKFCGFISLRLIYVACPVTHELIYYLRTLAWCSCATRIAVMTRAQQLSPGTCIKLILMHPQSREFRITGLTPQVH